MSVDAVGAGLVELYPGVEAGLRQALRHVSGCFDNGLEVLGEELS